jgi:hypothetical protein
MAASTMRRMHSADFSDPGSTTEARPSTLVADLQALAAMVESGALTDEEFSLGKQQLLSGGGGGSGSSTPRSQKLGEAVSQGVSLEAADRAHEIFILYDVNGSGSIDAEELTEAMKFLGQDCDSERIAGLFAEHDVTGSGELGLEPFLLLYAQLLEAASDELAEEKGIELGVVSLYGLKALMRWIHDDGELVGSDIVGPLVPGPRRFCRKVALSKPAEMFFYSWIFLSAVIAGVETDPDLEGAWYLVALGTATNLFFAAEVLIKMVAEIHGLRTLLHFLGDTWNLLDVLVLATLCTVLLVPALAGLSALKVLRILRFMRAAQALRAAKMLPQLALVMETLIKCCQSVICKSSLPPPPRHPHYPCTCNLLAGLVLTRRCRVGAR